MFSPSSFVRRSRRVKRIMSCGQAPDESDAEEVVSPYEEVSRYYPMSGVYRPIILIGGYIIIIVIIQVYLYTIQLMDCCVYNILK